MTGADIVTELIKIRHQRGMRQRDVAEKAGVCDLEARKRAPRLSAIVRYADAVGATVTVVAK